MGGEHREKYQSLQRQGDSGRGTQREIPVSTETGRQWEGNTKRKTSLYRDRETVGGEHREESQSLQRQRDSGGGIEKNTRLYSGRGTERRRRQCHIKLLGY